MAAGQSLVIYGGADGDQVLAQATVSSAQAPAAPSPETSFQSLISHRAAVARKD